MNNTCTYQEETVVQEFSVKLESRGTGMYSYCTLFDRNYLDKGLVLIDSFRKYNQTGKLYVLAMDDVCYECLNMIKDKRTILIGLEDFETIELQQAKKRRSRGEYCWTCASSLLYYIFKTYNEMYCTYVDADVCFYANPDVLVDEMVEKGKSVQIVEHRFSKDFSGKFQQKISGRFCVEFNTFKNDEQGLRILDEWREQTLKQCEFSYGEKALGDQMYLDEWPEKYKESVNILSHLGAGLAPWNLNRYTFLKEGQDGFWVLYDKKETPIRIAFFHYHGLRYISEDCVDIKVHKRFWTVDMKLVMKMYEPYLRLIEKKKKWIEERMGFCPLVQGNALGIVNEKSLLQRFGNLFKGNAYENIRIRIENHIKNILFYRKDIIERKRLLCNETE